MRIGFGEYGAGGARVPRREGGHVRGIPTAATTRALVVAKRPPMKSRVVRVPDKLWEAALARAEERGEHLSEAIRKFLERYTR